MSDRDSRQHEPVAKRRKVRKGTRSCWECRRRKEKCTFQSSTDTICVCCRRRSVKCVGQEFPDEISESYEKEFHAGERVARVEALSNGLDTPGPSVSEREEGDTSLNLLTPSSALLVPPTAISASRPCPVSDLYLSKMDMCTCLLVIRGKNQSDLESFMVEQNTRKSIALRVRLLAPADLRGCLGLSINYYLRLMTWR
jgi:hypothetical protein